MPKENIIDHRLRVTETCASATHLRNNETFMNNKISNKNITHSKILQNETSCNFIVVSKCSNNKDCPRRGTAEWCYQQLSAIVNKNNKWEFLTLETEVTLINRLWSGEQVSSQNRFKKFLKHAGQPTRKGIACKKTEVYKRRGRMKSSISRALKLSLA